MSPARRASSASIYQLRVDLKGAKPPIWRRLLVRGNTRLSDLHSIVQRAMGWHDYHLRQFEAGGEYFGRPEDTDWMEVRDERDVTLRQVAPQAKAHFTYEYDFGDSWQHRILVEKILPPQPGVQYPVCVTGKRACPPEDIGGIWSYAMFLAALRDPTHPEHQNMVEWPGPSFDSETFNLDGVNAALQSLG